MRLIIFDFDNTIFPTEYFKNVCDCKNLICTKSEEHFEIKEDLSKEIKELFNFIEKDSQIEIVTNANKEWLKYCLKLLDLNIEENIKINCFNDFFDINIYKNITIRKKILFEKLFSERIKNKEIKEIISIGDSQYDMIAGINLKNKFNNIILKNIFFDYKDNYYSHLDKIKNLKELFKNLFKCDNDLYIFY